MSVILLFAVFAAVDPFYRICQNKYLFQLLLNRGDTSRVFAADYVVDLFRKRQGLFLHNFIIFDDIDRDIVINKTKSIQINLVDRAFNLDDILSAHLVAAGIFNDRYTTVKFVQVQIFIYLHTFTGFNMIKYKAFVKSANI